LTGKSLRYGNQGTDKQGQESPEVLDAAGTPVPALRSAAQRLPEIPHLPDLSADAGPPGQDSRPEEGQLVKRTRLK